MTDIATLRVLADNPADVDLLGLSPIAAAVKDIVCADNSEPVTVGLHGPWGSGKSSLLQQILTDLQEENRTIAFELNPWEFDYNDDVKATIISTVLAELAPYADSGLLARLGSLAERISWKRVTSAIARGALTVRGDPTALLAIFSDVLATIPGADEEQPTPKTLKGFKNEFADVMQQLPVDRVVVLVDDLDRCLPTAVLSTLEAVKLFLAVPKMAFVVAADQQMVREAIAAGLGETRRSAIFARDYLEKIVQVPITVPQPTRDDAECYVALLLAHRTAGDGLDLDGLSKHAEQRRASGKLPYLGEVQSEAVAPQHLHEAKLIVAGLGTDDVVNPRRMKRFVNALAVRQHAAAAGGVDLDPAVIAKLYMLEHRFLAQMTELASLPAADRTSRLAAWEAWALNAEDGTSPGQPEDDLRIFIAAEPHLADRDTERYFVLARKLIKSGFVGGLREEALACLEGLLSNQLSEVEKAATQLTTLPPEQAALVVEEMIAQLASSNEPERLLRGLIAAADKDVAVEPALDAVRGRRGDLTPGVAAFLGHGTHSQLVQLATEFAIDPEIPELARKTLGRKN